MSKSLEGDEWRRVLERLAEGLPPTRQRHVILIGGVAMALAYGSRRTTQDADVVMPSAVADEVLPEAKRIAAEFDLPPHWMNRNAQESGHILEPRQGDGRVVLSRASVVFEVPCTEHLLAMKVARYAGDTDIKDAALLLARLRPGCPDIEDVWTLVGGYVPVAKRGQARHNLDVLWEMADEPA